MTTKQALEAGRHAMRQMVGIWIVVALVLGVLLYFGQGSLLYGVIRGVCISAFLQMAYSSGRVYAEYDSKPRSTVYALTGSGILAAMFAWGMPNWVAIYFVPPNRWFEFGQAWAVLSLVSLAGVSNGVAAHGQFRKKKRAKEPAA